MTITQTKPTQSGYEDAPPLSAVLTSAPLLLQETLAGTITALALIPEVISFSFVSGVDPKVALFSSIVLGLVMSALGGRPAMVTAAAGSIALVIGPMVKTYGTGYILPTLLCAGVIQLVFGWAGLAKLTRFIPRSVMIGFVNALGVLIFLAQVPHIIHVSWIGYLLFALAIAIVVFFPRVTTRIPAPLIAVVVVSAIVILANIDVPNVGGEGAMEPGLPSLTALTVPLDLRTLRIIWPTVLSVAFVGLLETLLTAKLVDEITDTRSNNARESWALGFANIAAGFYGGIGGCAMIAQTIVNVKIGAGRTRLSTAVAALVLLVLVTSLSGLMARIPMLVLAAVMMVAALTTINWHSLKPTTLKYMPIAETSIMLVTVVMTVATGNLAIGVVAGVLLALMLFARTVAHVIRVDRVLGADGADVHYDVHGPLFFGSSNDLFEQFSYAGDPSAVTIDLTHAQICDASSVAVLDLIQTKYADHGTSVKFIGLDERSEAFHTRLTGRL